MSNTNKTVFEKFDTGLLHLAYRFSNFLYKEYDVHPVLVRHVLRVVNLGCTLGIIPIFLVSTVPTMAALLVLVSLMSARVLYQGVKLERADILKEWNQALYQKYMSIFHAAHHTIGFRLFMFFLEICGLFFCGRQILNGAINSTTIGITLLFMSGGLLSYFEKAEVPPPYQGGVRRGKIAFNAT